MLNAGTHKAVQTATAVITRVKGLFNAFMVSLQMIDGNRIPCACNHRVFIRNRNVTVLSQ